MDRVYHSSRIQGLKVIEPRVSTHGESWVYAMAKREHCLMFLGNNNDLVNQTGIVGGMPYIAERFPAALEYAYKDHNKGSIYTLDGGDFQSGVTTFQLELVCSHACPVLEETRIEDALKALVSLASEGKLAIYRYPNLPPWLPKDKSDLIQKAIVWGRRPGSTVLESIEKFHPEILGAVKQGVAAKKQPS